MHKKVMEIANHIIEQACSKGIDNLTDKDWDDFKDSMEVVEKAMKADYYYKIVKAMEEAGEEDEAEEKYMLQRMKEEYGEDEGQRYYNDWRYSNGRYAPRGKGRRMRSYTEPMYHDTMYPIEVYRDWDRWSGDGMGRMYYVGQGSNSGSNGMSSTSGRSMNMGGQSGSGSSRGYSDGYSDGEKDGNRRGYEDGERDGYARGRSEGQRMTQRDSREGRSGQSRRTYMESKEMHSDNSPESKQAKMKDLEKYMNELSSDLSEMISGSSNEEKTMLRAKLQNLQQKLQ